MSKESTLALMVLAAALIMVIGWRQLLGMLVASAVALALIGLVYVLSM